MKYLFLIFCFSLPLSIFCQNMPCCASHELLLQGEKESPGLLESYYKEFEKIKNSNSPRNNPVYRIPVVFHVLWLNSRPNENIPDSCIYRQMDILNLAFSGKNSDGNNVRSIYGLSAGDSKIEFYLATKDPQGNPTNGIIRKSTTRKFSSNLITGAISIDMKSTVKGGSDPWDVKKYYNIWICHMPLSILGQEQVAILGFATPPLGLSNWPTNALNGVGADGAVIQYHFIGDNNPNFSLLPAQFVIANKGRTLIHETGHYLGLRHIWADKGNQLTGAPSCANTIGQREDDGIDDTPYCGSNSQSTGCNPVKNTCQDGANDLPDMWENYMDYSEERCQVLFTPKQIDFIRKVIDQKRLSLTTWDVTDISDKSEVKKINVYYHFQNKEIQIINPSSVAIKNIKVFDIQGRECLHHETSVDDYNTIPAGNLNNGVYLIQVQTKGRVQHFKIFKH